MRRSPASTPPEGTAGDGKQEQKPRRAMGDGPAGFLRKAWRKGVAAPGAGCYTGERKEKGTGGKDRAVLGPREYLGNG